MKICWKLGWIWPRSRIIFPNGYFWGANCLFEGGELCISDKNILPAKSAKKQSCHLQNCLKKIEGWPWFFWAIPHKGPWDICEWFEIVFNLLSEPNHLTGASKNVFCLLCWFPWLFQNKDVEERHHLGQWWQHVSWTGVTVHELHSTQPEIDLVESRAERVGW